MKKTKLAVLFAAFVSMLGLSSCLGDPDPFVTNTQIMRVASQFPVTFEDPFGIKLEPTNQSIFATRPVDEKFSLVQYKYDTREVDASTKKVQAEVLGFAPIQEVNTFNPGVESNCPMHDISKQYAFFDENSLFLVVSYYFKNSSKQEDLSAELNKHHFYLVEDTSKVETNENTMNLLLVHKVDDPDNNKDRTTVGNDTRYINLSNVLQGKTPDKIVINYKVKGYGSSEETELIDATSPVEINYKEIIDAANSGKK